MAHQQFYRCDDGVCMVRYRPGRSWVIRITWWNRPLCIWDSDSSGPVKALESWHSVVIAQLHFYLLYSTTRQRRHGPASGRWCLPILLLWGYISWAENGGGYDFDRYGVVWYILGQLRMNLADGSQPHDGEVTLHLIICTTLPTMRLLNLANWHPAREVAQWRILHRNMPASEEQVWHYGVKIRLTPVLCQDLRYEEGYCYPVLWYRGYMQD